MRRILSSLSLALLAVGLAACSPEKGDDTELEYPADSLDADSMDTEPHDGDVAGLIQNLTVIENPRNVLSSYVEWETTRPASTHLELECGSDWTQTYDGGETTRHRVFVMGLWDGAQCEAEASSTLPSGATASETTDFEVGPLPSFLPEIQVKTREPGKMQPGWTMTNLWNNFDDIPLTVGMFDSKGRYRWYHQLNTSNSGSDTDVRLFRDKVLIGGNRQYVGPRLVTWEGKIAWKDSFKMHHDIRPTPDGEHFLYLSGDRNCPDGVPGSTAVKYDWKNHSEVDRWNICDYYMPPAEDYNSGWSHVNTILQFSNESALLLSSRNQHTLFKIDTESQTLLWKMGLRGDFGLSGDELFYRQHAPEFLPNGNILLYDNGAPPRSHDRPWSRVIEISYDPSAMTAEIVWEYRPNPDIFTPIWGDADHQKNGNVLATFGLRNTKADNNSQIIEVTSDKTKVWHVEMPNKWGVYRSERIPDLPVGKVLEP